MNFSEALIRIKAGARCRRQGWNGRGMFVYLVPGSTFTVNRAPLCGMFPAGTSVKYQPHIDICTADCTMSVWQPSMGDVMAEDWEVVN